MPSLLLQGINLWNCLQKIDFLDKLGERLEADEKLRIRACLCYVCSGNIDKFVRCWDKINAAKDGRNAEAMQVTYNA